ncbi:N-acetylneuraminate synthase [Ruegeria sp. ANG-S4]|uniref:pseudaminic acid synthase n=1 Tax=Ruegeria sp. ANG-S4 TaxID=1577904 RepID=UPI00057D4722|nr:pseudaminic acid synthase [Ruegeria sp. ANG-S4]KIC46732.1 N-acetylneuraminate synthase [Ruegeria sp. ANG-S4]
MKTVNDINIDGRPIGQSHPPYVIAELSANHNGDLYTALLLIDKAVEAGADAIKIQTYRADTITLPSEKPEFQINSGLWKGRTLHELYEWAHTPWDWHQALFDHARERGITMFSSPFDKTAVDFLDELSAPAFKIASFEAIDLPLIRYVAGKGKPMIISTGMADRDEIAEAITAARDGGCKELVLLHCVSGYPAPPSDYNLSTMADIAARFDVLTGLSDHTIDNTTAVASVALGGVVIEKHLTLDRDGGGPDDSFSLEPVDLAALCRDARTAWEAIGHVDYGRKSSERENVKFRRSLYFCEDIEAGQTITEAMVRSVRPGYGLAPKYLNEVIGSQATVAIKKYTAVAWDMISAGTQRTKNPS